MEKKEMDKKAEEMKKCSKGITRKDFLKGMGTSIAGVTVLGGVGTLLAGCTEEASTGGAPTGKAEWPFAYQQVDADAAAQRAYDSYKSGRG